MAELYAELEELPTYYDRRTCTSLEDWREAVRTSRVVYVGNLNYFTTEEELYECDGRVIRVDPDSGRDVEGDRKFGRGTTGRQWRDEWRDFYDPGRGGEGGEHGKRAREEFEASLMASQPIPMDPAGYPRNVRHRWGPGGPPRGPRPPFPIPPPPAERGGPPRGRWGPQENSFGYKHRKFSRGRRN